MGNPKETLTQAMVQLLREYRVVIYAGSSDPLLGPVLAQAWIDKIMQLSGEQSVRDFAQAQKYAWRVSPDDAQVAGYARKVGNLTMLWVRGAGHIVPYDQPRSALDILERMLHGYSFTELDNSTLVGMPSMVV